MVVDWARSLGFQRMLSRFRKIREPYRMFLIGFATLGVTLAGLAWPNYAYPMWGVFLLWMGVTLYEDRAEPVNYDSIRILDEAIEYKASGQTYLIRYDEIGRLEYVREYDDYPNEIESKWIVHFAEGTGPHLYKRQEILNEWPDSRKLLRA